jgi:hypothetical protein
MRKILAISIGMLAFSHVPLAAQMPEDGMLIFERYDGVSMPHFQEYFQLLKQRYEGSDATGWGIYVASPRVAYRLSAVPEGGMQGVLDVRQERIQGFDDFTEREGELWGTAWAQRRQMAFSNAADLSMLPEDFGYDHVQDNPYTQVVIALVKPSEIQTFESAVMRLQELDKQVGNDQGAMFRAYRGDFGTPAPAYLFINHAESMEDMASKVDRWNMARMPIMSEWQEAWTAMTGATRDIEVFTNQRVNELSHRASN